MSGGLDSSVAAFLLKEQGYDVTGITMCLGIKDGEDKPKCCGPEAIRDAKNLCHKLGILHYVFDFSDELEDKVVNNFLDAHKNGRTPNPCVECNKFLKFGALFEKANAMGFDYLSTGHHIRTEKIGEKYVLKCGIDKNKDQSYFLYHLNQEQLKKLVFPIGHLIKKTEIRALAEKYGINEINNKKESQGVCFFPEDSYIPFLERNTPDIFKDGNVVYHGGIIGKHKGLPRYTVGQRRGVDVGGFEEPIYVKKLDYEKNELIMGDDEELFKNELLGKNFILTGLDKDEKITQDKIPKNLFGRIRHLGFLYKCYIELLEDNNIKVNFEEPVRAITAGQTVVFYSDDEQVIGGAEIVE